MVGAELTAARAANFSRFSTGELDKLPPADGAIVDAAGRWNCAELLISLL
jgi:hypothetical protein